VSKQNAPLRSLCLSGVGGNVDNKNWCISTFSFDCKPTRLQVEHDELENFGFVAAFKGLCAEARLIIRVRKWPLMFEMFFEICHICVGTTESQFQMKQILCKFYFTIF